MKWQQARALFVGVILSWLCLPSVGRAGWITLASGTAGNAQPTGTAEFWYGSAATPFLAIDTLTGAGTVQATTGDGTSFFNGLGTPVLLNLSDGSVYVAGGSPPAGATDRGPGGALAGTPASTAPQAGVPVPPDYARLGIVLTAPDVGGAWVLTASVLGSDNATLGSGSVVVPDGGWWVLGLGAGQEPTPEPLPNPTPVPTPEPVPTPAPGVPEPTTMALAVSGVVIVVPWLRRKYRARSRT